MKEFNHYQKLWHKAAFVTVSRNVRKKIQLAEVDKKANAAELEHLNWRLALNLYKGSRFEEAMELLVGITTEPSVLVETPPTPAAAKLGRKQKSTKVMNGRYIKHSLVNQTAGRCAVQLFLAKEQHSYLEKAHSFYQVAVENMEVNLFTMFKLPELLLEFGLVLEYYGAFEAASDIYGRILSGFPNFRGYFDALYRTAIVGRHLASLVKDAVAKEEMCNKSIDILQFLLEALPAHIPEVQVVMIYGRTLELSSNKQVRFRSHAVYRTLFELCQKQRKAGAHLVGGDAVKWLEEPLSWLSLADEMAAAGESLIAKDGYEKFMDLKRKYKSFDKQVHEELDVSMCLKLAKSAARYQNYAEAIRYAELGLRIDRYHRDVRFHLANWSRQHQLTFESEKLALRKIVGIWKGRCWTDGFRQRLKEQMIADLEARYEANRWDVETREQLAYYAKDSYRSKFLFEVECVLRLQRFFRQRKKQSIWQEVQRQHHCARAADVFRRYQRLPRDAAIRQQLLEVSSHRLVPRKHPVQSARRQIEIENRAVYVIERSVASYRFRSSIARLIKQRKDHVDHCRFLAARTIQCAVRVTIAIKLFSERYELRQQQHFAARIIQKFVHSRSRSLFHVVQGAVHSNASRLQRAKNVLRRRLPMAVWNYFARRNAKALLLELRQQRERKRKEAREQQIFRERAAFRIQRFCRKCINKFWSKISIAVIKARRAATFSYPALEHLSLLQKQQQPQGLFSGGRGAGEVVSVAYSCPGINASAPQFQRLLQQETVLIDGSWSATTMGSTLSAFEPADCMMLCLVLRNAACKIKHIVLKDIALTTSHISSGSSNSNNSNERSGNSSSLAACLEFDLIPALSKCRSIRSLHLYGSAWPQSFLLSLLRLVQVENLRITALHIEKPEHAGMLCEAVSSHAGFLLCDYFNYTAPGIVELSLHGCAMRDADVALISSGLAVNSSIRKVCLSLNLITDVGFVAIFGAVCRNKRSQVEKLDFNWNLIQCHREMRDMLRFYKAHRLDIFMELHLLWNRIYDRYHPVQDLRRKGDITQVLRIFYTPEEVDEARDITVRYQRNSSNNNNNNNNNHSSNRNNKSNNSTKNSKNKQQLQLYTISHESQGSLKHRMRQMVLSPLRDNMMESRLLSQSLPAGAVARSNISDSSSGRFTLTAASKSTSSKIQRLQQGQLRNKITAQSLNLLQQQQQQQHGRFGRSGSSIFTSDHTSSPSSQQLRPTASFDSDSGFYP